MIGIDSWTCPSCNSPVASAYCPACGERRVPPDELTLRGLVGEAVRKFAHVDGRLLRSLASLVTCPGELTLAFLQGRRKTFIGPISLFLVANVLFFGVESLTGGTIFATPLRSHLHTQPWSGTAAWLVSDRLASLRMTQDAYAPRFDTAIGVHARSLILVMAVCLSPVLALVFRRSGRPFAAHAVFSLHLYGFMLLLFSAATAIPAAGMLFGGLRSTSENLDRAISLALLVVCATYLYRAIGVVYGGRSAARVLESVSLTAAMAAIVLGYRFALFVLTLHTTS
jgi:uncharacterized protein DUF3667